MSDKRCTACRQIKDIEQFRPLKGDKREARCFDCVTEGRSAKKASDMQEHFSRLYNEAQTKELLDRTKDWSTE